MHMFAEWLLCAGYYCLISWLLRAVLSMYSSGWKTANKEILWGKCCARIMMEGRSRKINEFEMRWGEGCSLRREQWSTRRRGSKSWQKLLRNLGVRERQEPRMTSRSWLGRGDGSLYWDKKWSGEESLRRKNESLILGLAMFELLLDFRVEYWRSWPYEFELQERGPGKR